MEVVKVNSNPLMKTSFYAHAQTLRLHRHMSVDGCKVDSDCGGETRSSEGAEEPIAKDSKPI